MDNQNSETKSTVPSSIAGVQTFDCSESPLDLCPAVDQVENLIRKRLANNPVEPLIVMMGENHSMATHVALQQMIMARLVDPKNNPLRIAVGTEWPHNIVDEMQKDKSEHAPIPGTVRDEIAFPETGEKRFLRAYQTALTQHRATVTHRNLMAWVEKADVSVRPVDAAWHPNYGLDRRDPVTDKIIKMDMPAHKAVVGPNDSKDVDPQIRDEDNARYMRARNLVVRDRVRAHIADTNAQVYFLPYGASHILGTKGKQGVTLNSPFKDSLVNLFTEANMQTLPVLMAQHVDFSTLPAEAPEALRKGVVISGLSSRKFQIEKGKPEDTKIVSEEEKAFIREINNNSGGNALQLFEDNGTKASFGYGDNHTPAPTSSPMGAYEGNRRNYSVLNTKPKFKSTEGKPELARRARRKPPAP